MGKKTKRPQPERQQIKVTAVGGTDAEGGESDDTPLPPDVSIMELRYTPNPRVLDKCGQIAFDLMKTAKLPKWATTNKGAEGRERKSQLARKIFVHHDRLGIELVRKDSSAAMLHDAKWSVDYFAGLFGTNIPVTRIGVRTIHIFPFSGSYHSLLDNIEMRCAGRNLEFWAGTYDLEDSTYWLHLKKDGLEYVVSIVPCRSAEAKEYFNDEVDLPDVGLLIDVDCFTQPKVMTNSIYLHEQIQRQCEATAQLKTQLSTRILNQ